MTDEFQVAAPGLSIYHSDASCPDLPEVFDPVEDTDGMDECKHCSTDPQRPIKAENTRRGKITEFANDD